MTTRSIMMFHQGAELYGSDYMFLMSVRSFGRDHRVHVVLDSTGPLVEKLRRERIAGLEILPLAVLRRSALRTPWQAARYLWQFGRATVAVRRLLRRHRPDVVYANTLGVLAPLVAAIGLGMHRIQHLHEIFDRPRLVFRTLYTLGEWLSRDVLCVSDAVRQTLTRMSLLGGRRGRVVHNGIAPQAVTSDQTDRLRADLRASFADPDLPLVAYVSRLHYWKGQAEFLGVAARLKDGLGRPVNTAFFGAPFVDYPGLTADLERQASAMGLAGCVRFFGFRSDAAALFALADLSVMGSVAPDPFPTVVLESMAQGCPVVGFDHGGTPEMIAAGPSGILVPPCDADAMAAAIAGLLDDPSTRQRLSDTARRVFAERFTLDRYIARLRAIVGSE